MSERKFMLESSHKSHIYNHITIGVFNFKIQCSFRQEIIRFWSCKTVSISAYDVYVYLKVFAFFL